MQTSNIHNASNRLKDSASPMGEKMSEAADVATDFYHKASDWLGEGYGKSIGIVALVAAVGVFGYLLGRGSHSSSGSESLSTMSHLNS